MFKNIKYNFRLNFVQIGRSFVHSCLEVLSLLNEIFESSNDTLNKMSNFQQCYELQYMFEPPLLNIIDQNRQLIKQGDLLKVAKRSGEFLPRHLALVLARIYYIVIMSHLKWLAFSIEQNEIYVFLFLISLRQFSDMLLVCKYDRIRKKLLLKYSIPSKEIKLIENSNESNELMFRIVSSDQNNEFKAEYIHFIYLIKWKEKIF